MLRKELQPPKIDEKLVEELMQLISNLSEEYYEKNEKTILKDKIDQLNSRVHKKYELMDFQNYQGATSLEDFAIEMSLPNPPIVKDVTVEEVGKIIEMIIELKSPEGIEEVEEDEFEDINIKFFSKENGFLCDVVEWIKVNDHTLKHLNEETFNERQVYLMLYGVTKKKEWICIGEVEPYPLLLNRKTGIVSCVVNELGLKCEMKEYVKFEEFIDKYVLGERYLEIGTDEEWYDFMKKYEII